MFKFVCAMALMAIGLCGAIDVQAVEMGVPFDVITSDRGQDSRLVSLKMVAPEKREEMYRANWPLVLGLSDPDIQSGDYVACTEAEGEKQCVWVEEGRVKLANHEFTITLGDIKWESVTANQALAKYPREDLESLLFSENAVDDTLMDVASGPFSYLEVHALVGGSQSVRWSVNDKNEYFEVNKYPVRLQELDDIYDSDQMAEVKLGNTEISDLERTVWEGFDLFTFVPGKWRSGLMWVARLNGTGVLSQEAWSPLYPLPKDKDEKQEHRLRYLEWIDAIEVRNNHGGFY